jgi:hypothetical protein
MLKLLITVVLAASLATPVAADDMLTLAGMVVFGQKCGGKATPVGEYFLNKAIQQHIHAQNIDENAMKLALETMDKMTWDKAQCQKMKLILTRDGHALVD